jgi:hypothetical protein
MSFWDVGKKRDRKKKMSHTNCEKNEGGRGVKIHTCV